MPTKLRIILAVTTAPLLLAPTCGKNGGEAGDAQVCQDATVYLESTCGVAGGVGAEGCTVEDECVASCVLAATCDALTGADADAAEAYDGCALACVGDDGSGGDDGTPDPSCSPCAAFLNGTATYEEICPDGQQLLDAWSACICAGPCEIECFEHCQGYDPNLICSDCVEQSCAAETQACRGAG
ncbi:MAG: hypothetical protein JRI68_30425 [Deltaproteobacteria bacterium]|nr:hypothetical protein [Deltaproteobacteria bacterium]